MGKIRTRYGDGSPVELSESELMEDLERGTTDAAERGNIPALSKEELQHLVDIFKAPYNFVSVEPGKEVVLSYDAGTLKIRRVGVNVDRIQALQIYEKLFGADTMELCHVDYSFKPIKPIVTMERPILEQALLSTHIPLFYGAMPNLGLYSQPDGPYPNPAELLPQGKIDEAQQSYEATVDSAVRDILYASNAMWESGADGINLDTVGAAGDADFQASLIASEKMKEKYPDICIELGMAGEFILGMHSELEYDGVRLAGLYPHNQVKLAEKAGVTIFGPVINTNTSETCPWNLSRSITFIKECSKVANIPIHVNMGMGVGAVTVNDHPPVDIVSRASKAMVEICRLDGLQVGVGDPLGMALTHAHASGMGGMRAAGDLVARVQMARGMRIQEAKAYVAERLKISVSELTDPVIMNEIRDDLQIGLVTPMPGCAKGIEAKFRIAEVLGLDINCVKCFKDKTA